MGHLAGGGSDGLEQLELGQHDAGQLLDILHFGFGGSNPGFSSLLVRTNVQREQIQFESVCVCDV
jgi:hypothetical protein